MKTNAVRPIWRDEDEATRGGSFSYWFAFSYVPPAVLVGREARMS